MACKSTAWLLSASLRSACQVIHTLDLDILARIDFAGIGTYAVPISNYHHHQKSSWLILLFRGCCFHLRWHIHKREPAFLELIKSLP